ncbi:uncharacterized protein DMENIID0001_134320 [Sergentomyia squamirostris]
MSSPGFLRKYIVTIVMIPSIIGIHYAWTRVQNMESLVQEHEKQDLPIVIGVKKLYNNYFNTPAESSKENGK